METYVFVLEILAVGFQIGGLIILISSGIMALAKWFTKGLAQFWRGEKPSEEQLRLAFGHRIVLSLEFFIGADIIKTIQSPTFADLAQLGIIVIIRTILHYSLT